IRKIAGIEVDISKRPLRHLPGEQIQARWDMHHCEHTDMAGLGRVGRYDPKMVIWQTHLVNNDLEIRNFDFSMWVWWVNLLRAAGLRSYLARFLDEKGRLLESFACYRKVADQIGEWKREIDPMVPTTLINETNFRESDRGGTSWG